MGKLREIKIVFDDGARQFARGEIISGNVVVTVDQEGGDGLQGFEGIVFP